jgi:spoIIIJ-associated protein
MDNSNEFKASNVGLATKNGLTALGLTEEEADIEVISRGGIFSKAVVKITPKIKPAEETEAASEDRKTEETEKAGVDGAADGAEKTENAATEEKRFDRRAETSEEREARYAVMKSMENDGRAYLEEVIKLAKAEVTLETKTREDEVCFYIGGADAKVFIGFKGETLEAVQTLLSQFLNKGRDGDDRIRIVVDADFYRERRKRTLVNLAKKLAEQANGQHREIALEPMNSYERRIIHSALQDNVNATTRSDGEGRDRHVVIIPKGGVMSYGGNSDFRKKGPAKTKSFGYSKRKF